MSSPTRTRSEHLLDHPDTTRSPRPRTTKAVPLTPGLDGLDFLGVGGDALVGDDVAEVGDGGFEELALGGLTIELVLSQEGEDLSDVFGVFGVGLTEDE